MAMRKSDKVQSSEKGKKRLRKTYKDAGLTQDELAEKASVSVDTLRRLLGTKDCPNGIERWAVTNIAEVLNIKPIDIVDPKDWYPQQDLPLELERLFLEKTQSFCGRQFVFDAIQEFINKKTNGYFTLIGDAGMGKTAIAAKYVLDNPEAICFFNIRAEGMNRPELFLKKIRQQLMNRYQLHDVENADLSTLLTKVKKKLVVDERLLVVVDALDEVDQEASRNLLYLPAILPERVYFILTRRPPEEGKKKLMIAPGTPRKEFDLRQFSQESRQDVKEYIWKLLNDGKYKQGLNQWITKQKDISNRDFVEQIAVKSENNFMYLRCVLQAIADGFYKDKPLDELPEGLEAYYAG